MVPCSNVTKDGSQCAGGNEEPLCYVCRRRAARTADPDSQTYYANVKLKRKEKEKRRKLAHRNKEREFTEKTKEVLDSFDSWLVPPEKKKKKEKKAPKFLFMLLLYSKFQAELDFANESLAKVLEVIDKIIFRV